MSFQNNVQNDGDAGTIDVWQAVNLNEKKLVLSQLMDNGDVVSVQGFGSPPGDFNWLHHATNLTGSDSVDDGGTLHVNS